MAKIKKKIIKLELTVPVSKECDDGSYAMPYRVRGMAEQARASLRNKMGGKTEEERENNQHLLDGYWWYELIAKAGVEVAIPGAKLEVLEDALKGGWG